MYREKLEGGEAMIDTFEIAMITGRAAVNLLCRGLEMDVRFNQNFYRIPNPLGQPGVRAINIKRLKNSEKCRIAIEINPAELLAKSSSIELFHCSKENVETLQQVLNEGLEFIDPYFSLTNSKWRLSRIDYAAQFYTTYVELYTVLESKGPIPYRFEGLQKPGSTYNGCKSSRVNAYNKGDQISKTNSPEAKREEARRLYRFEYQCLDTRYLCNKYKIARSKLFGLFKEDIALEVLKAHHARHIKAGDYYTYDEAAKRIRSMVGKQQQTKELALEILSFVEDSGSFSKALQLIRNDADNVPERFKGAKSGSEFNKLKDKFYEFIRENLCKEGINPVLLPSGHGIVCLPNSSSSLFID